MPIVFRWNGYRFFFFSNEGNPLEPCHIHVAKGDSYAKIWLEPQVMADQVYGFDAPQIHKIIAKVEQERKIIKEEWNEYFNKSN